MVNTISTSTERFLADLSNLNKRIVTAQRQVSSGLRMQDVSDAPDQNVILLQLKSAISHNDQVKMNLGRVQAEVNAGESAINTATTLMDRARQIASQGVNTLTGNTTRVQLADQVKDIIIQMYGLTKTNVEGRYVFSGDKDDIPPFTGFDLTTANGVGTYQGGLSTRVVEHPNGSTFAVSLTAEQVFDNGGASTSVLKALTSLYNNLMNNDVTGLATDVTNLASASTYLDGQQAMYGEFQNQVQDAISFQAKYDLQLQTHLSIVQDADEVEAITTMQNLSIAQNAALQAQASMPKRSLFDYLG